MTLKIMTEGERMKNENLAQVMARLAEQGRMPSAERRTLPRKTILLNEGEVADTLYLVEKGCLRLFFLSEGRDITFKTIFVIDFCLIPAFVLTSVSGIGLHLAGHGADHSVWHDGIATP